MDYSANVDAVEHLIDEVLPKLERRDAKLQIVGSNPRPAVRRAAERSPLDVEVLGPRAVDRALLRGRAPARCAAALRRRDPAQDPRGAGARGSGREHAARLRGSRPRARARRRGRRRACSARRGRRPAARRRGALPEPEPRGPEDGRRALRLAPARRAVRAGRRRRGGAGIDRPALPHPPGARRRGGVAGGGAELARLSAAEGVEAIAATPHVRGTSRRPSSRWSAAWPRCGPTSRSRDTD